MAGPASGGLRCRAAPEPVEHGADAVDGLLQLFGLLGLEDLHGDADVEDCLDLGRAALGHRQQVGPVAAASAQAFGQVERHAGGCPPQLGSQVAVEPLHSAEDLTDESVRETLPGAEAASLMGELVEAVSLYESLRDAATRRLFVEAAPESAAAAGGELGGGNLCSRPRTLREQHSDVSDVSTAASRTNIAGSFERKGRDALEGAEDDSTLAPWSLPRPPENRLQEGVVRGGDTQVSSDSRSSAAAVALARVMAQADSEWSTTKPSWVPQFREKVQELIAAGDADGQRQTTSLIQELLDLSCDGTL